MNESKGHPKRPGDLRRQALKRAFAFHREPAAVEREMSPDVQRLVQELHIHQIELELQNEELQRTRTEAEQALARYADLYEFAPFGYFTLDRSGTVRQVNLAGSHLVGVERARLVGMNLALLVATDCSSTFAALLARVFECGTKQDGDVVMQGNGREPVTLAIGATASEDGQECRIVATDVSERKREQEILSIRLQLQQFAVSHSRKDLLRRALDEVERITGGQLGACYLLAQGSLVREAWSTSTRRTFSDAADAEPVASSLVQSGAWADSATQCHPIVHNDPAWPLSKVGLPELDAEVSPEVSRILVVPILRNEEVVALVGVANKCTDFTPDDVKTVDHLMDVAWSIAEQKKAVEDQKYLQLRLQLVESQKMEAIGTLAGGIAHDFNNILAGILGGLTLIDLDLGATDEKKASVQEMMGLVRRGSDLTRQLLGFARRGKYDIRRLDLARVVTKTSAMFGRTRKELTIRLDFPPGLRAVLMDRTQLEQVLLNLFVNAAHAMPGGGVLSVSAENQEATKDATKDGTKEGTNPPADGAGTGNFVKLVVRDTGTGMDAATQARIFEPFFTTKGPGQGTGLGLASVYGIVKSHEGFITVKSAPGQGTAFSVYLPATDQPSNEDRTPAVVIERGAGTIMIVDDEPPVLDMLTRLLKKIGYQVLSASSGHAAVELVRQYGKAISLVILDMIMPEMSGSQTYDALREVRPDLKVLVSSGYSMEEQARDMLGRGCRGFIQKPFDIAALSSTLRALV